MSDRLPANERPRAKINWLLILLYLLLLGGVVGVIVYLAVETHLHPALALTTLFGVMGGMAFAFFMADKGRGWLWMAGLTWAAALFNAAIFLAVTGWLHPALLMALLFFLAAGGVTYWIARRQRRTRAV